MKILNFGSLNIDYVYSVEHFVRAGETIASNSLNLFCGGKGLNQSVAFAKAGADTYHAGSIGKEGAMLTDMLRSAGANTDFVAVREDISCGHAIIQVNAHGENCILLYGGANHTISDAMVDEVLSHFGEGDMLMLQNEINNIPYIIAQAKKKGMIIALNPSPFTPEILGFGLDKIDWLILNETEGQEITGKEAAEDIISELGKSYPEMRVVLTLGKQGATYAYKGERASHGIFDTPVADTTAAGDTFTGYFFAEIMSGNTPAEALRIASAASAIAVSRKGAAPSIPTKDEVVALLEKF
ncbi:MAG: ribokinase [Clostridia bacterium]|nr:ribokinase [Clostridia bacterium]